MASLANMGSLWSHRCITMMLLASVPIQSSWDFFESLYAAGRIHWIKGQTFSSSFFTVIWALSLTSYHVFFTVSFRRCSLFLQNQRLPYFRKTQALPFWLSLSLVRTALNILYTCLFKVTKLTFPLHLYCIMTSSFMYNYWLMGKVLSLT